VIDVDQALTVEGFELLQREVLESQRKVWPFRVWRPSALGHPCDRHLVWMWNRIQDARVYSWVLQSIFNEGRLHQPSVYARLEEMGFEIVREQDRPLQYRLAGGALIAGTPDGRIVAFRGQRLTPTVILEAKSIQEWLWAQLRSVADILESRHTHIRGYYAQVQLYCLLDGATDRSLMVLKSKSTGLLKPIPIDLDYDFAESLLKRVERLEPLVRGRVDPPPIPYEKAVCDRCAFLGACYPPRSFGEGVQILEDPQLEVKLDRRATLAPGAKEYDGLDDEIKESLKHQGVRFAVVGPWVIEGRQAKNGAITYSFERLGELPKEPA
jgi:hypothetical protein